jgi:tetratricopeptide (TPR) repeat protein
MHGRPESERLGFVGLASVLMNTWLSFSLNELGQFPEAQARAEEALLIATTADQPFSLMAAHLALGILGLRHGSFARAAAAFRSVVEFGRTWDMRTSWPGGDAGLACALALQGECEEATCLLAETTMTIDGTRVGFNLAQRINWEGEAARWCGRPQDAERLGQEGLRFARARKERGDEAWALRLLGDLASDLEPPDLSAAEGHYHDALALADALGMRPLVAHCHRGLGVLYLRGASSGWPVICTGRWT